ncbi:hypothetical protein GQ53DRAFT_777304 [Thozetella sp. PMI_491]|nr:hypothetical protein GQ53DRAFT_777304 [Thozetella sp. PMI_491]
MYSRRLSTKQFQLWYPQYGWVFETILHQNCSNEYNNYLTGVRDVSKIDKLGGGGLRSALTQPVITCILTSTSEYIKTQLSASQVLLGVAPTILALIGPSTDETATLLLVARRPLLYLLIISSSPSVFFSRAFEYSDPLKVLEDRGHRLVRSPPTGLFRAALTVGEYVIAIASVGNIAHVSYELGLKSICIFMSTWTFTPLLLAILGVAVHLFGAITLRLRVRRLHSNEIKKQGGGMPSETKTIGFVRVFPETRLYAVWAWILSASTITHILFGTLLFSSTLFVGPEDAVPVITRYMASVMACRVVLRYELSGLQDLQRRHFQSKAICSFVDVGPVSKCKRSKPAILFRGWYKRCRPATGSRVIEHMPIISNY